jgi:hypothetical protein
MLKFFYADTGSGIEKIRIRDKHPESATPFIACFFFSHTLNTVRYLRYLLDDLFLVLLPC